MGLDEKGFNRLVKFIWDGISVNGRQDIFKVWKYLASHGMYHKRFLVCKIH